MSLRSTVLTVSAVAVLAVGAGIAAASESASPSGAGEPSASASAPAATADGTTYEVGDAGTVTIAQQDGELAITDVTTADGWTSLIEVERGREVEVDFTNQRRRVDFDAELEGGQIRVDIDHDEGVPSGVAPTAPTAPAAPGTGSAAPEASATGERRTVDAGPAGTVEYVFDEGLLVTSVDAASGWTSEIEEEFGDEIEVVFTNGSSRIDVEVEIEDGAPRERVRDRDDDDDDDRYDDDRDDWDDDDRDDDRYDDDDDRHDRDDDDHGHDDDRDDWDDDHGHDD